MFTPSNKIIQHLVKIGKLKPIGLQHFGGKHYYYIPDEGEYKGRFNGNFHQEDYEELAKTLIWMTDEEIENIMAGKNKNV